MEYLDLITNVGFPIVVTVFVLVRLEKSMNKVEDALIRMSEAVVMMEAVHKK